MNVNAKYLISNVFCHVEQHQISGRKNDGQKNKWKLLNKNK